MRLARNLQGRAPLALLESGMTGRAVLCYIALTAMPEGEVNLSVLAGLMGSDARPHTVKRALKELRGSGWADVGAGQFELLDSPERRAERKTAAPERVFVWSSTISEDIVEGFRLFWDAYPRRVGKAQASTVWNKLAPSPELTSTILEAVAAWKKAEAWQGEVKFIPHPRTFLFNKRWEDELPPSTQTQTGPRRLVL